MFRKVYRKVYGSSDSLKIDFWQVGMMVMPHTVSALTKPINTLKVHYQGTKGYQMHLEYAQK